MGDDPGKIGINGALEKEINLQVAEKLKAFLEASDVKDVYKRQAVESVKQAFCQIGAGAEELHFLTDSHGGYTAGNAVVIAVGNAH